MVAEPGYTVGDRLAKLLTKGRTVQVTFSAGSVETGEVEHVDGPLWVLRSKHGQHYFTLGEVLEVDR